MVEINILLLEFMCIGTYFTSVNLVLMRPILDVVPLPAEHTMITGVLL
jgi:hypothetical protein